MSSSFGYRRRPSHEQQEPLTKLYICWYRKFVVDSENMKLNNKSSVVIALREGPDNDIFLLYFDKLAKSITRCVDHEIKKFIKKFIISRSEASKDNQGEFFLDSIQQF